MKTIEIYCDGSCQVATQQKNGTCAFVVVEDSNKVIHQESYRYSDTTNNRMELQGAIQALRWIRDNNSGRVYISMDSQYVQVGISEWVKKWQQTNWKTSGRKDVQNKDLWVELVNLKTKLPNVQFQWVRGHSNNKYNEMADKLCTEAYKNPLNGGKKKTARDIIIAKYPVYKNNTDNDTCKLSIPEIVELMEQYKQQ